MIGEGILWTAAAGGGGGGGPRDGGGGGAGGESLLVGTGSADGMVRAYDVNLAGGGEATSLGTRELGGGVPVDVTVHPRPRRRTQCALGGATVGATCSASGFGSSF